MSELPKCHYLRRGVVRDYFGITDEEFSALVRAGVFKTYYLQGRGRAWFRREEVLAAEAANRVFKPAESAA